jgi:hypothetical protein
MTIYLLMAPACIEVLLINVPVLDKYLLMFRRSKVPVLDKYLLKFRSSKKGI